MAQSVCQQAFSLLANRCLRSLGFESCSQQRKTTCLLSIRKSLACARASKLTTTNMYVCMGGWMDEWMDGSMYVSLYVSMYESMYGSLYGFMHLCLYWESDIYSCPSSVKIAFAPICVCKNHRWIWRHNTSTSRSRNCLFRTFWSHHLLQRFHSYLIKSVHRGSQLKDGLLIEVEVTGKSLREKIVKKICIDRHILITIMEESCSSVKN